VRAAAITEGARLTGTVGGALHAAATSERATAPFLVTRGRAFSFGELEVASGRLATALLAEGLGAGDRVTTSLPNGIEWVITALALARIGVVNVLANPRYRPSELDWLVENSGSALLVGGPGWEREQWEVWAATPLDQAALAAREAAVAPHDVLYIIYTSGTTGRPKGSMTRHGAALRNAYNSGERQGFTAVDRLLCYLPTSHCFGAVNALLNCLTHRATLVLEADFDAGAVLEAVERQRITAVYGVPTHFIMLADALRSGRRADLSSLVRGCIGGGEISGELADAIAGELGVVHLTNAYGMTESTAIISQTEWRWPLNRRLGATGRPLPGVEVRLVAEDGSVADSGDPGEIHIRGFNVHAGYFGIDPDPSARADGWWATGDLGVHNDDGDLRIFGRSKDMYKTSGFNVYPVEVENLLDRHPDIAEVAIVGVPDRRKLETGTAFVVLRRGTELSAADVQALVRRELVGYKVPDHVFFVAELPRSSATLKVQKHELRRLAVERLTKGETHGNS
jgi:acyl-CoA synthetase (AMP-forming)/AMP-acid ligase II